MRTESGQPPAQTLPPHDAGLGGRRARFDAVLADRPSIHVDDATGTPTTFGLLDDALDWLIAHLAPGQRTLETGCGLSTIAFALARTEHTTVVPSQDEVDRLRAYCHARDIPLDTITFVISRSEEYLPGAQPEDLDLALIDGSHSFPHTFIDAHYLMSGLRVGGNLIVDDTHIWTGRVLRDFLRSEPEWRVEHEWYGRTIALRKTQDIDPDKLWTNQELVMSRSSIPRQRFHTLADLVRDGNLKLLARKATGKVTGLARRG